MTEKYIPVNQYMKMFNVGYETVMNQINTGQLEYKLTPSGKKRIRVGGDTVSKEAYEKLYERCIKAETILSNIGLIIDQKNK